MVVILPVEDFPPVVLFPDELAELRRRVGESVAARGWSVVPVAELERIEAAAAQGRLVLEGDLACRAPLTHDELMARYFGRNASALVEVACFATCWLQVSIDDGPEGDLDVTFVGPRVTKPHDPAAWIRSARSLEEGLAGIAGVGVPGSTSPAPPVTFERVVGIGPWRTPPSGARLEALAPQVARCGHPDPHVGLTWIVKAELGPDGRIDRCSARSEHPSARVVDGECLCQSIETLRHPAGPAGRRLWAEARDEQEAFADDQAFELLQPGTEGWVRRLDESRAVAACLQQQPLDAAIDVTVVLDLAPDGEIDRAQVFGELSSLPRMRFAGCLVRELAPVALPCRPPGIEQLQVRLRLASPS